MLCLMSENIDFATLGNKTAITTQAVSNNTSSFSDIISITVTTPGEYLVIASGSSFNVGGTGSIGYAFAKNGTAFEDNFRQTAGASGRYLFAMHTIAQLSINDKISIQAKPVDGGTSEIRAGARLSIIRIG